MPSGVYKRKPLSKEIIEKRTIALRKIVRTPEHRAKLSKIAKKNGNGLWMKGKKHSKETINKMIEGRFAEKGSSWKGGRFLSGDGYIYIHTGIYHVNRKKRYILEHRLIMEKHLGRPLKKGEVVHHINSIRDDNRIENLKLYSSHSEHMKIHRPKGQSINPRDRYFS